MRQPLLAATSTVSGSPEARGLAPREHGQAQVRAKAQDFHEATCALVVSPSGLVLEDQPVRLGMADVVKDVISTALRADAPP